MSGFIPWIFQYEIAAGGGVLISGETDAMGIDFTYHTDRSLQMQVITASVAVNSDPFSTLTYTSPSIKLCRQSDGVWRYANHNLCIQSQTFDNAAWTNGNTTETANATTAPDGTSTADTLTANSGSATHNIFLASGVSVPATALRETSVFIKKGTHRFVHIAIIGGASDWAAAVFDLDGGGSVATQTATGSSGTVTSTAMQDVSNGWFRLVLVGSIVAASQGFSINFSGAATGNTFNSFADVTVNAVGTETFHMWGAQIKRHPVNDAGGFTPSTGYIATTTAAKYDLPYEWDVSGNSLGILIEEQRTNLSLASQTMGNTTYWSAPLGVTVTSDAAVAPDGTTTAEQLTEDTGTSVHSNDQNAGTSGAIAYTSGTTYTFSIFAKKGTRNFFQIAIANAAFPDGNYANFDLNTGVVGNAGAQTTSSIVDAGNGWYRCIATCTADASTTTTGMAARMITSATSARSESYLGTSSTLFVWGSQVEAGAFPTSPIHTIAATVTRAVDRVEPFSTSNFPYSATVGTMVVQAMIPRSPSLGAFKFALGLDNGAGSHRIILYGDTGSTNSKYIVDTGGSNQAGATLGTMVASTNFKLGVAWAVNDYAAVQDGGTVQTDASASVPTMNQMAIGVASDGSSPLNGYIRQVTYLARRATNVELQTKTT